MGVRKKAYDYDYSGSCAPLSECYSRNDTFSVGIFKWIPKASGNGLKKTAVIFRVKGYSSNPKAVYNEAERICRKLKRGVALKTNSKWVE